MQVMQGVRRRNNVVARQAIESPKDPPAAPQPIRAETPAPKKKGKGGGKKKGC